MGSGASVQAGRRGFAVAPLRALAADHWLPGFGHPLRGPFFGSLDTPPPSPRHWWSTSSGTPSDEEQQPPSEPPTPTEPDQWRAEVGLGVIGSDYRLTVRNEGGEQVYKRRRNEDIVTEASWSFWGVTT